MRGGRVVRGQAALFKDRRVSANKEPGLATEASSTVIVSTPSDPSCQRSPGPVGDDHAPVAKGEGIVAILNASYCQRNTRLMAEAHH